MQLLEVGEKLASLRKQFYPDDNQTTFAFRIGVSRATYQKMEKGDLTVSMHAYFKAAELLGVKVSQ
jgi:DNA-binding XRE family transcriptional regulator